MSLTDVDRVPLDIKYDARGFVRAPWNPPVLSATEKVLGARIAHVAVALGAIPTELAITEVRPFAHAQEVEQEG